MNTLRVDNKIFKAEYIVYVDNVKVSRPSYNDVFYSKDVKFSESTYSKFYSLLFNKAMIANQSLYAYFDINLITGEKVTKYINFQSLPDNLKKEEIREKFAAIDKEFGIDKIRELTKEIKEIGLDGDFKLKSKKIDEKFALYRAVKPGEYFNRINKELVPDIVKLLKANAEKRRNTVEFEINKAKSPRVI
jgi:hypothetical protein